MVMAAAPPVSFTVSLDADALRLSLTNTSKKPVSLWAFSLRAGTKTPSFLHAIEVRAVRLGADGGAEEVWNVAMLPPIDDLPGQPFVLAPGRTIDDVFPLGHHAAGKYRVSVRFDDGGVNTLFKGKHVIGALPAVTLELER